MNKIVIGITGGIASGKSEVRKMLEKIGCLGIDADQVGHALLEPGTPINKKLIAHFGNVILQSDTESCQLINREKLGKIVFNNPEELAWLERQLHPAIAKRITEMIVSSRKSVALEAIKLMQSDLSGLCDWRWLVTARDEKRIDRLIRHRNLSKAEAEQRLSAQKDLSWPLEDFDYVFDSSGTLGELRQQVVRAWNELNKTS